MRHLLRFSIFESLKEIQYYKEFPEFDTLTDLLESNNILDYEDLTDLDIKIIDDFFEKLGYSYHRTIKIMPYYLDVLVNETDDYVACNIEIRKHIEDWYEVIFFKKKRTAFGEGSYTQSLEFNRWLCNDKFGIYKLLKKIAEDYTWLKTPIAEIKLIESINLEELNHFTELNMDDDLTAEYIENILKVEEYDILDSDVNFILNLNNRLGLKFNHDIKIHSGREGKEKKVLMIWYNYKSNKLSITLIVNIRRIKDDYFYVFIDVRGTYSSSNYDKYISPAEKKYFLCDGLSGLIKFLKHIKEDYLTF